MQSRRNLSTAISLGAVVLGMLMLAYASVPLYRLFCQVTGYGGTTREAAHAPGRVFNRTLTIRFNADIDSGLPWEFRPVQRSVRVKVGEEKLAFFHAKNLDSRSTLGQAVYNVTPDQAGSYFVKIECFCFQEQPLAGLQEADMPVSFYIDPSIMDDREMDDVSTITLSYTFFPLKK